MDFHLRDKVAIVSGVAGVEGISGDSSNDRSTVGFSGG